ncbi:MAG: thiol:disulfide interchange protein DsbA/DsbL [Betaproteobacteria bacterium]|nr:thiol:disulfide interchange protein DsbA/DsbL [Betaproteobacteria bacterium]
MSRWLRTLFAVFLLVPLVALAQFRAGDDYVVLEVPQAVEASKGKIEVVEFFWYGCIHCYNLEPLLEQWIKRLKPDVQFRRIPAVFSPRWGRDAAIFYAMEALGVQEKLHRPLFDAIHRDHLNTEQGEAFNEWLAKQGLEARKFEETVKSFSVQSKARRAAQLSVSYRIDGTPALAVHGRYTIPASQRMLGVADYLIGTLRSNPGAIR